MYKRQERVSAAKQEKEDIPFVEAFKATVTNRYFLIALGLMIFYTAYPVSYTHLDVYKRQAFSRSASRTLVGLTQ